MCLVAPSVSLLQIAALTRPMRTSATGLGTLLRTELHRLATQVDEDRRSAGQARAVLLAAAGRRAFEPQAVRRHAAQDLGATAAKRVALTRRGSTVFGSKRFRKEQCRPERRSARSSNVCERMDQPWRLPAEVMCRVQREKTWYSGQRGCILSPCQGQNGNPGLISKR